MIQKLKYILEACAAGSVYLIFAILDVDKASALGGWLGRKVGPYLSVSKIARNNIKNTFPNLNRWFNDIKSSDLFLSVMNKYDIWNQTDCGIIIQFHSE